MDNIVALTIWKSTIKRCVTKFLNFLQNLSMDENVSQILVRKQKIEEFWEEFPKVQFVMEIKVADETAATAEENCWFEFEDLFV